MWYCVHIMYYPPKHPTDVAGRGAFSELSLTVPEFLGPSHTRLTRRVYVFLAHSITLPKCHI